MEEKKPEFVISVQVRFTGQDYAVFATMLAMSAGIGVYFACTGGRQRTTREFLMADRNMNPFPVAMSLVASFISAITFLGTPAETYIHGIAFWLYSFAYVLTGLAVSRFYMPIFFRLNLTSANEVRQDVMMRKCMLYSDFLLSNL